MKNTTSVWNDGSPAEQFRNSVPYWGEASWRTEARRAQNRSIIAADRARRNQTDARVLTTDYRTRECLDARGTVQPRRFS